MNREFSWLRRLCVACVALLCAAFALRLEISQSLVIRGDDYLYRGDRPAAIERYRRALLFAQSNETAADRYIFMTMQTHTAASLARAISFADRYLEVHHNAAEIYADRALCYLHIAQYARAERDFAHAARLERSPKDYVFAGWAARRAGSLTRAASYWRQALQEDRAFAPARFALAELHRS